MGANRTGQPIRIPAPTGEPGPNWIWAPETIQLVELKAHLYFRSPGRSPYLRGFAYGDVTGTVLKYLAGDYGTDDRQAVSRGRPVWDTWNREAYAWNVHLSLNIDQALSRMWRRYGVNPEDQSGRLGEDLRAMRYVRIEWRAENTTEPSVEQLAELTGLPRDRMVHLLEVDARTATRSLHGLIDHIAATSANPEDDGLFDEVWQVVTNLPEDQRQLIERRWIEMESPDAIADDLGVTRRTVDRRMRTALTAVRDEWQSTLTGTRL